MIGLRTLGAAAWLAFSTSERQRKLAMRMMVRLQNQKIYAAVEAWKFHTVCRFRRNCCSACHFLLLPEMPQPSRKCPNPLGSAPISIVYVPSLMCVCRVCGGRCGGSRA